MKNIKSVSNAAKLTEQAATQRQLDNNRLLLTLWLVVETGLFASLIYANFVVRAAQGQWPPLGADRMNMGVPLALTVAIVVSSVTAIQAVGALRRNDRANFTRFLIATIALGIGFVVGVISLLTHIPFRGPYNAFFVSMWFVHVSHAIAVLLFLGYVLRRATQAHYTATAHWPVEAATYLWHFLDVMWIVLFVVLYLV
jgi:heme/copper-type cytochrome/quinol oxidase subunit 3